MLLASLGFENSLDDLSCLAFGRHLFKPSSSSLPPNSHVTAFPSMHELLELFDVSVTVFH
jgi:hypothetical protein